MGKINYKNYVAIYLWMRYWFNDTYSAIELANLFSSWAKFLNDITKLFFWPRLKTIEHVIQVIK